MRAIEIDEEHIAELKPILCTINAAVKLIGRCERSVNDLIARGEIAAVKSDRRTLILYGSIIDYVGRLKKAELKRNSPAKHY